MDQQGGPPNVRDQPEGGQLVETPEEYQARFFQILASLNKPPQQHPGADRNVGGGPGVPGGQMGPNGMPNGAQGEMSVEDQAAYSEKLRNIRGSWDMVLTIVSQCRREGIEGRNKLEMMSRILDGREVVSMEYLNDLETWIARKKEYFLNKTRWEDNHVFVTNRAPMNGQVAPPTGASSILGGPGVPGGAEGQKGPNGMPNGAQGEMSVEDQTAYSETLKNMRGSCDMLRTLASQCRREGNHYAAHKSEVMLDVLEGKRVVSLEYLNHLETWVARKKEYFLNKTRWEDNHTNRPPMNGQVASPTGTSSVLGGPGGPGGAGGQMRPNEMPNGAQEVMSVEYQAIYSEKLRNMRGHCEMLRTLASQCRQEGNHYAAHKSEAMLDVLEGKRFVSMELLNHLETWFSGKQDNLNPTRLEDNHANRGGPGGPAGQMGPNEMPNGAQGEMSVEEQAAYSEKLKNMRGGCDMLRTLASQCRQEGNQYAAHKLEVLLDVLEGKRVVSLEYLNHLETWVDRKQDFLKRNPMAPNLIPMGMNHVHNPYGGHQQYMGGPPPQLQQRMMPQEHMMMGGGGLIHGMYRGYMGHEQMIPPGYLVPMGMNHVHIPYGGHPQYMGGPPPPQLQQRMMPQEHMMMGGGGLIDGMYRGYMGHEQMIPPVYRETMNPQPPPQNAKSQQEETPEEYQARSEDNLAFAKKELAALFKRNGLEHVPPGDPRRVDTIAAFLQARRMKDPKLWHRGLHIPRTDDIMDIRVGSRDQCGFRRDPIERERNAAGAGRDVRALIDEGNREKYRMSIELARQKRLLKEEPIASGAQVEVNKEPDVRVMMKNLKLGHVESREEEDDEDDWVMVEQPSK